MKIRAKANGNILEVPDDAGERLIATGIYEEVDVEDEPVEEPPKRAYKRRDLTPEK